MNILIVHNRYQFAGGEDQVASSESQLLEAHGHRVFRFTRNNDDVKGMSSLSLAASTIWNVDSYRQIREIVTRENISVAHFHNTLPLVSPGGYYAARAAGAAVVQTLHNYRLLCVGGTLYRDGAVCEDCLGHALPRAGVSRRCYRKSLSASGAVAAMLTSHRLMGTWRRAVTRYVALTDFAKRKFVAGGVPASLISVKPNFVETPMARSLHNQAKTSFLYVGRLVPEKGLVSLVAAFSRTGLGLAVVGEGPMLLESLPRNIELCGRENRERIFERMTGAIALVFPSVWYEGFPMVIAEAFATGLPVIASRIGGIPELVEHGKTGLLYRPGDARDLAGALDWAAEHPEAMQEMGRNAFHRYQREYAPEPNYRRLMSIYEDALSVRHARAPAA